MSEKKKNKKQTNTKIERGSVRIVKVAKAEDAPKPLPGVAQWVMTENELILTPGQMHQRGWVRRKF